MQITSDIIKVVQASLNKQYRQNLVVDGDAGRKTMAAIDMVPFVPTHWKRDRKIVGYIQHASMLNDINAGPVDGYWGPQTDYAYELLKAKQSGIITKPWRDDEGLGARPSRNWPNQEQSSLQRYFGTPGQNQGKINSPYPLKIAWNTAKSLSRFSAHEKVCDSAERVLGRVLSHYGQGRIQQLGLDLWGGCLNVRKMRGGTKWSTHAWGIAMDWDPARNRLRWGKDRATLATSEYDMWWKLWEEEGWVSLGRARNYDWMHVQAATVR